MKLPVSLKSILKGLRQMRKELSQDVKIVVAGESLARQQDLIAALASGAEASRIFLTFECKSNQLPRGFVSACLQSDVVLVLVEKHRLFDKETNFLVSFVSQLGKPFSLVLEGVLDSEGKRVMLDQLWKVFNISSDKVVFVSAKRGSGLRELAKRIVSNCHGKEVALGSRMPLLQEAAASEVVKKVSRENGLIGLVTIFPGSDMPILTANQMKMVLKIAAIHNQKIDVARLRELVAVLSSGFAFRAFARQLLGLVPGPGWMFKGAVAYGGTRALGKAVIKYFQSGLSYLSAQDLKQILTSKQ